MTVLLDTHVALWMVRDEGSLGHDARKAIGSSNDVRVSVASIWEIAIKHAIGKLGPPEPVVEALTRARVGVLDITTPHVLGVTSSPLQHQDPLDRLIVAQAHAEGATLYTADAKILAAELPFVVDARR